MHGWLKSSKMFRRFLEHREWAWECARSYPLVPMFAFMGIFTLWLILPLFFLIAFISLGVGEFFSSGIIATLVGLVSFLFLIVFWPIVWRCFLDFYWGYLAVVAWAFGHQNWADAGHSFAIGDLDKWKEAND